VRVTRLRRQARRDGTRISARVMIDRQQRILGARHGDQRFLDQAGGREGIYRVELRFPCESPIACSSRA